MKTFSVFFTVAAIGTAIALGALNTISDGLYAGCVCLLVVAVSLVWIACIAITTDASPASAEQLAQSTLYYSLLTDEAYYGGDDQDDESGAGQAIDPRDMYNTPRTWNEMTAYLDSDPNGYRQSQSYKEWCDFVNGVDERSAQPSNPEAERHMMHSAFLPRISNPTVSVGTRVIGNIHL